MTATPNSSNIQAYGYDPANETLRVQFKGGGTYDYRNVTADVYGAFLEAPSVGKYFASVIRPGRTFEKVEEVEEEAGE
jgi:hypothetical protein